MCSLEKVHFCIYHPKRSGVGAHEIVVLLQRLRNVRFLTLNSEIVELISSSMEQTSFQPLPFTNLKSILVYPGYVSANVQEGLKVSISTEVRNYLLDSSPSATLIIESHEALRAYRNAESAQTLMVKLWTMLEDEKNSNSTPCMDQRKATANSHKEKMHEQENAQVENQRAQPFEKMQTHISEMMGQIKSSCEDLGLKVDQGRAKATKINSTLRDIEVLLLTKLPASKKDKLHADFSSPSAETDTVVKRIIDRMKVQYVEKHSHVIDCFH